MPIKRESIIQLTPPQHPFRSLAASEKLFQCDENKENKENAGACVVSI